MAAQSTPGPERVARSVALPSYVDLLDSVWRLGEAGLISKGNARAISDGVARINRAQDANDAEQIIGSAKDLVESVARISISAMGDEIQSSANFPLVVTRAHSALRRLPSDFADNSFSQRLISRARATILDLGELRNAVGTGHGRIVPAEVPADVVAMALSFSGMWTAWAIRRVESMYSPMGVQELVDVIECGDLSKGELSTRLSSLPLTDLATAAQYRLGLAVGRRAVSDTWIARYEGVHAASIGDQLSWPLAYRSGLIAGLLLNTEGQLHADEWAVERIEELVSDSAARESLDACVDSIATAGVDPIAIVSPGRERLLRAIRRAAANGAETNVSWSRVENLLLAI